MMTMRALFLVLVVCATARAGSLTWTERSGSGPSPREEHAMAFDTARGVAVLFGGYTFGNNNNNDNGETWEWNGSAWTQRSVTGPSARYGHGMAYDAARGVTVLFGGVSTDSGDYVFHGDTWEWDGTSWTERLVTGTLPRSPHALAYDSARGVTVLFGGDTHINSAYISYGDTWEWDGTSWTERMVSGPWARSYHAMTYDAARGVTVLFGGLAYQGPPISAEETWEWDGNAWTQRVVSGPSGRYGSAMAYDTVRHMTVLFGGGLSDTWEWDGSTWSKGDYGPARVAFHAMVFDSFHCVTLLFGGRECSNVSGETWVLGAAPIITQHPTGQHSGVGEAVRLEVFAAGCLNTYQWRRNGLNIVGDPHIFGENSPVLIISAADFGDDASAFDCVVTNESGSTRSDPAALSVTPRCGSADFNGDGDIGTDADIEAFFRVLGGGAC